MNAGEVITLITLICGLIGAVGALIPTLVKLFNALKEIVKNKNWEKIIKIAYKAVEEAEKTGKSGAEKKEIAIAAVKAGCAEAGIELDVEQANKLADYIDELIEYFNNMSDASKVGKKAAKAVAKGE